jgi:hypothetical protein
MLKAFRDPIPPAFYLARLSRAFFVLGSVARLHTFAANEVGNRTPFGTAEGVLSARVGVKNTVASA